MNKKTVKELQDLGYNLLAYSSGGDLKVQSFIAKYKGKRVHGWFVHSKGVYEFD